MKYSVTVKSKHLLARSTTTDKYPALRRGATQTKRPTHCMRRRQRQAYPMTAFAKCAVMTILLASTAPRESSENRQHQVVGLPSRARTSP